MPQQNPFQFPQPREVTTSIYRRNEVPPTAAEPVRVQPWRNGSEPNIRIFTDDGRERFFPASQISGMRELDGAIKIVCTHGEFTIRGPGTEQLMDAIGRNSATCIRRDDVKILTVTLVTGDEPVSGESGAEAAQRVVAQAPGANSGW